VLQAESVTLNVLRADTPRAARLRFHCLSGDDLALASGMIPTWFFQVGPLLTAGDRPHRLMFIYSSNLDARRTFAIDVGTTTSDVVARILQLASGLTVAAADHKWRSFVSQIGHLPEPVSGEECSKKIMRISFSDVSAARRTVHPAYIIDHLMMRARMSAATQFEELLYGGHADKSAVHNDIGEQ
jgi:hypothetical protein